MLYPRRRRPILVKVFGASVHWCLYLAYYWSNLAQTCMDDASGVNEGIHRLKYWIWAIGFGCRRKIGMLVLVKVFGASVNWCLYLTYYWSDLPQTCMDDASGGNEGMHRLKCWIWAIGFGCWRKIRMLVLVKVFGASVLLWLYLNCDGSSHH